MLEVDKQFVNIPVPCMCVLRRVVCRTSMFGGCVYVFVRETSVVCPAKHVVSFVYVKELASSCLFSAWEL